MRQAELVLIAVIAGIAGYAAYPVVNPACASASAVCLNGMADAIISPGAEQEMLGAINSAQRSLHVILYEFSYAELKEALVQAQQRGVDVKLILEPKVDQNLDTAEFLKSKGIEVRWSSGKFNNMHAKTAIIDGKKVLIGSLNWSRNAMFNNREVGVLVESERIAEELEAVFEEDWGEALEVI